MFRHPIIAFAAAAVSLALATPASSTIVLSDDFDAENGGDTALNYTGFANWDVQPFLGPSSAVDIVNGLTNPYGIECSGICVDLDGSTGFGGLISTKTLFAFGAGDRVTLSLDIAGNQRGGIENYALAFLFPALTDIYDLTITDPFSSGNLGDLSGFTGVVFAGDLIPFDRPFGRYSLSFRTGSAGVFGAGIGTDSTDNVGPLIDNVVIEISPVPEPASWALMIAGFGLAGGAMRQWTFVGLRRARVS